MSIEKRLENRFIREVKSIKGAAVKFGFDGWPDRVALLPGGRIIFVEFKDARGTFSARQILRLKWLRENGFEAYGVSDDGGLSEILKKLMK